MTRSGAEQAARLRAIYEHKDWSEEQASEPLRDDVAAALEDSHPSHIGLAKAVAEHQQAAVDRLHDQLARESDEKIQQAMFVKRGARHYVPVEKVKDLSPGEHVFVRRESSNRYDSIGIVNSLGELPEQEIQL